MLELVEEPNLPQGTWHFGEGTMHHHAFDVGTSENQLRVKDYIVGLGYTDVSDVKDRGYFFSVYLRTPGGALFELAYSTEAGFTIDEAEDELGTHMCIPPHWEDRRAEIATARADRHRRDGPRLATSLAVDGCSVARWTLRLVTAIAIGAALLSVAPAAAAGPATITGKLAPGTAKLPKSASKGEAQVLALEHRLHGVRWRRAGGP